MRHAQAHNAVVRYTAHQSRRQQRTLGEHEGEIACEVTQVSNEAVDRARCATVIEHELICDRHRPASYRREAERGIRGQSAHRSGRQRRWCQRLISHVRTESRYGLNDVRPISSVEHGTAVRQADTECEQHVLPEAASTPSHAIG